MARRKHELSRRGFVGGAAASAAAIGIGAHSGALAGPAAREASILSAGFQAGENVILIGTLGEASTINPFQHSDTEAYFRCKMMFDQFVRVDPATYAPVQGPGLAESWELEDLTYTFHIHANATFSDGTDLTADDVAFTIEGNLAAATASPNASFYTAIAGAEEFAAGTAESVSGLEVVDAKTLKITLAVPDAPFLFNMRNLFVVPKAALEGKNLVDDEWFKNPIGAGPFKFVSWAVGGDWVATKNETYYQEGKPGLDGIIHRVIADANTLALALQTGEVDGSVYPSPTLQEQIEQNPDMTLVVPPFTSADGFTFNLSHEWLGKVEVRQAICHAIDVAQYAEDTLQGKGGVAAGPLAPGNWAFDQELKPLEYNQDKARELLASVEFPEGTQIHASANIGNVLREDWLIFSQQELAKIGIDLVVENQEYATLVAAVTGPRDFEMSGVNFGGATADPSELISQFTTGASGNYTGYSNAEIDELLARARQELDIEAAKLIYKDVQRILTEEAPIFFAWYRPFLHVIHSKYTGWTGSNLEQGLFYSTEEITLA